jgi:hypothetical protein
VLKFFSMTHDGRYYGEKKEVGCFEKKNACPSGCFIFFQMHATPFVEDKIPLDSVCPPNTMNNLCWYYK